METYTLRGCQAGHWALVLITVITSSPWERQTERNRQKKKKNLNFYYILYIERQVRWDKTARILCSTFFNLSIFPPLQKEKFLFHSLFLSLNLWKYYIHDNTSLLVVCLRFLLLFGTLIHLLLLLCDTWTQGKKTPCFNNTLLRAKRNSYNKTTLVKNSQRHVQRKWARDWDKNNRQRPTGTERVRKAGSVRIHQGMLGAERSVPTFRQDPKGTSYRWQFQVQYSSIMELVPYRLIM